MRFNYIATLGAISIVSANVINTNNISNLVDKIIDSKDIVDMYYNKTPVDRIGSVLKDGNDYILNYLIVKNNITNINEIDELKGNIIDTMSENIDDTNKNNKK